jgi:cytoplasmic iron level regulating protein YaaA (DUF328/UPF0246 family)
MSTPVVLLSCVKSKRAQRCRAGDMYTSPLFQKMMAYAESLKPSRTFILSAKYGLLSPDDLIEPYELTLKKMKKPERRAWADKVLAALRQSCDLDTDEFVFLAGVPYRENLVSHIRHYTVPMEGLDFGTQLRWLGEQVS